MNRFSRQNRNSNWINTHRHFAPAGKRNCSGYALIVNSLLATWGRFRS
jgi:hypothetical protein